MELADENVITTTAYGDVSLPSEQPSAAPEQAPQATAPEEPWWKQHENSEMEFQAAGKQIKAPFSKVRQWAQQGYDYAQRMQAFNQEKAAIEAKAQELAKDGEWAEVVKFARENPEWAQATRQAWEQRQQWQQSNADNPLFRDFQALKSEIEPLKALKAELEQEKQRIEFAEQDKALEAEIGTIRDKYAKLGMDLSQIDPDTGLTFENSVLKYGSENGIKSFKTAFLELYADKVESLREEAIKKQVADEYAKRQKDGFIGRTPTPTQKSLRVENAGKRSWASLIDEANADVAAGKY